MDQKTDIITAGKLEPLNGRVRWLIFLLVLLGLGLTIYRESLYALFASVLQREGSSHVLFVPFISGYIIWLKIDKIKGIQSQVSLPAGAVMVMAGIALFYLGRASAGFSLPVLSFLLVAGGLILTFFGRDMFREVGFPLFFLATMIPLPEAVYIQMAEWMRQAITWPAIALIKPLGIPLHRVGYDIYLPDIHLYVAYGCSGIRYLLSYFVFGIAYAYRFKHSSKARLLVVLATVPLSIAGGVLRLWIIFTTAYFIGPVMTEKRPHVFLSWSVFTVVLVAAIGVDRYVSRSRGGRSEKSKVKGERLKVKGKRMKE
jgi:exosortase